MRTIKFRAYHPKLKKMIEIDLNQRGCSRLKMLRIEVSPTIELMEFTGLFDKHGKEIWEGDVCKCTSVVEGGMEYSDIGVMTWNEKGAKFNIECNNSILNGRYEVESIEILGDIYSNPELLEAK